MSDRIAQSQLPTPGEAAEALAKMPARMRASRAEHYLWLIHRAERIEKAGNAEMAATARAEAVALLIPPKEPPTRRRCDNCGEFVTGKRLSYYNAKLGVDWVICATCQGETPYWVAAHMR